MADGPPRLLPNRLLPPYTYIPGKSPHPVSDPRGHSFGLAPVRPTLPADWKECTEYLWGLELFNHGFFWEAHEAWEGLWHAAGRKGPLADFFKGLIQLAVAEIKRAEGREDSVRDHAARGVELLRERGQEFWGLDISRVTEWAEGLANRLAGPKLWLIPTHRDDQRDQPLA